MYDSKGQDFIDYIQKELTSGKSLEDIAADNGKTKEAVRSKLKRERKKVSSIAPTVAEKSKMANKDTKEITIKTNKNNENIEFQNINNKLEFIINLLEKSNETQVIQTGVQTAAQIQLENIEKREYIKTSMRLDKNVWEEFKKFAEKNKENYKQQDLITLALQEFLDKYK